MIWKKNMSLFTSVLDLMWCSLKQIKAWEESEMDKPLELERVKIDPSPFQLVERTSLHKASLPPSKCTVAVLSYCSLRKFLLYISQILLLLINIKSIYFL